ncbi:MAG: CPBP family intramembrane metalloprotease [Candidatus Eremiobacteraeota bacterium]|nr:CPBP family intramembrane metalloprotease [Candidatus Eremiobacteraeota bacterium]
MTDTPGPLDFVLAFGFLAAITYEWIFPALRSRRIAYAGNIVILWTLTAGVAALWLATHRPWSLLFLGPVVWWRFSLGCVFFILFLFVGLRDRRVAQRHPQALAKIAQSLRSVKWMMPVTPAHLRWWIAVSVTAGITEEFLCRGFLLSLVAHYAGLPAAVVACALIFGVGHGYQHPKNILPTAAYGFGLTVVILISGSLLPAMAIHVAQDYFAGELAYFSLRTTKPAGLNEVKNG